MSAEGSEAKAEEELWALALVWSASEPQRVGEMLVVPSSGGPYSFGRAAPNTDDAPARLLPTRPSTREIGPPLIGAAISRRQLRFMSTGSELALERVGQCVTRVDGAEVDTAMLKQGSLIELDGQLLFRCVRVPSASGSVLAEDMALVGWSQAVETTRRALRSVVERLTGEGPVLVNINGADAACGTPDGIAAYLAGRLGTKTPFVRLPFQKLPEGIVETALFGSGAESWSSARGGLLYLGDTSGVSEVHRDAIIEAISRLGQPDGPRCLVVSGWVGDEPALNLSLPPLAEHAEDTPLILRHWVDELIQAGLDGDGYRDEVDGTPFVRMTLPFAYDAMRAGGRRVLRDMLVRSIHDSDGRKLHIPLRHTVRKDLARPENEDPDVTRPIAPLSAPRSPFKRNR